MRETVGDMGCGVFADAGQGPIPRDLQTTVRDVREGQTSALTVYTDAKTVPGQA